MKGISEFLAIIPGMYEAYSIFPYMYVSTENKIIELTKPLLPLATESVFHSVQNSSTFMLHYHTVSKEDTWSESACLLDVKEILSTYPASAIAECSLQQLLFGLCLRAAV